MNKEQKAESVKEIKELIESSEAMYFTDFARLTVEEVNELRKEFYKSDLKYKVVKNTLTVRALRESEKYSAHIERLDEILHGPTSIVFAYKNNNPILITLVFATFASFMVESPLETARGTALIGFWLAFWMGENLQAK